MCSHVTIRTHVSPGLNILECLCNFFGEISLSTASFIALLLLAFKFKKVHILTLKNELAIHGCQGLSWFLMYNAISVYVLYAFTTGGAKIVSTEYVLGNFYTKTIEVFTFLTGAFILVNTIRFIKNHSKQQLIEYPVLVILSIFFLQILIISNNLIITFIGLVGFSLNLYVMIMMFAVGPAQLTTDRPADLTNNLGHEASIKYFYLSTFSSALVLLSIVSLYTITQTSNFMELMYWCNLVNQSTSIANLLPAWVDLLKLAFAAFIIGFSFKLSAFPAHVWAPEVYEGSSNPITAFIIIPVKLASISIFIRILVSIFGELHVFWEPLLSVVAIGSLIAGALGALTEKNFKRFLAYSSINQVGFLLLGFSNNTISGVQSSIFFLIIYILTNVVLFGLFFQLEGATPEKSIVYLTDFNRIKRENWFVRVGLTVVFFSFAGLPPFAGFFSKFYVLMVSFQNGSLFAVFVGITTTLISAYYYLRIIKLLWFEQGALKHQFDLQSKHREYTRTLLIAILLILITFLFWDNILLLFSASLSYACCFPLLDTNEVFVLYIIPTMAVTKFKIGRHGNSTLKNYINKRSVFTTNPGWGGRPVLGQATSRRDAEHRRRARYQYYELPWSFWRVHRFREKIKTLSTEQYKTINNYLNQEVITIDDSPWPRWHNDIKNHLKVGSKLRFTTPTFKPVAIELIENWYKPSNKDEIITLIKGDGFVSRNEFMEDRARLLEYQGGYDAEMRRLYDPQYKLDIRYENREFNLQSTFTAEFNKAAEHAREIGLIEVAEQMLREGPTTLDDLERSKKYGPHNIG